MGDSALPMNQTPWAQTYERVCHMCPVDAALQLQLIVGLDVEQEVLVKSYASHQVSPVGALQGAAAVDVLGEGREAN